MNLLTMKKLLFIAFAIIITTATQARETSKSAYISILTCSPGNEIYSHFGHTAIRYVDKSSGVDIVFNYGLFSYSEDFAYNFVKGETYYQLGVQQFSGFISEYYLSNRGVIEQKLNLTPQEVQSMFEILRTNYRPENRKYLYNFFYDNCSTRPRDVLQKVLGNQLQWETPNSTIFDTTWIKPLQQEILSESQPQTWRSEIHCFVGTDSWLRFGIDLGLGFPTDDTVSLYNTMFLPDGLCLMVQSAKIEKDSAIVPLVASTQYLYKAESEISESSFISEPASILWIICLLFLGIAYIEYRTKKHAYWLDVMVYFIYGLVGIFVWYVSLYSIHPAVFPNFNCIWASPFHILFAIVWCIPKIRNYTKWYTYIYSILILLYIITIPINPQFVHPGYIALMVILVSRVNGNKLISK